MDNIFFYNLLSHYRDSVFFVFFALARIFSTLLVVAISLGFVLLAMLNLSKDVLASMGSLGVPLIWEVKLIFEAQSRVVANYCLNSLSSHHQAGYLESTPLIS